MLSVIVPTLGSRKDELVRLFDSIEAQTYKDFEIIVVTQDNHEIVSALLEDVGFNYKQVKLNRKGLSHSRNMGLQHIQGDYVTFSDDDCWYLPESFEKVIHYFEKLDADILCFKMYDPDQQVFLKDYPSQYMESVTGRGIFKKSSIEIFINLNKVNSSDLAFDENFGLGAKYPSGEENIFLVDLKKRGYNISYYPETIVYHEKKGIDTRLGLKTFIGKGPMFKRMYNTPKGVILLTAFFLKKYTLLEKPIKFYLLSLKETINYKR